MPEATEIVASPGDELSSEQWLAKRLKDLNPETPAAPKEEAKTAEVPEASQQEQKRDDKGKFTKEEPAEDDKVSPGVQKRIDKAVAKQREAERRAEEAERRLQEKQVTQPAKETAEQPKAEIKLVKPKLSDFDDYQKYEDAKDEYFEKLAKHTAAEAVDRDRKARAEAEQKAKQVEEERRFDTEWKESEESVRESHADYDEKVAEVAEIIKAGKLPPLNDNMRGAIAASDAKAELLYYLVTHQDDYKRIAVLPVHKVGYELGKIEAKLEKPIESVPEKQAKPKKELPKPPENVTGKAAASSGPSEEDDADTWAAKRTKIRQAQGHQF